MAHLPSLLLVSVVLNLDFSYPGIKVPTPA